jgi:hypothetical protein
MQVENDYDRDVYNGDLGVVSGIDMEEGELSVDFDSREVTYGFGELDELVLAYATTIHKSQGSEYPAVVIPLSTQHYPMLQRNLVYTGVTRGKRLVVLVGQRKALAIAVKGSRARRRWSKLREWLIGSVPCCGGGPLKPKEAAAVALWRLGRGVGKAPEIVAGGNRALAPPISRAYHHRAGGPRIL